MPRCLSLKGIIEPEFGLTNEGLEALDDLAPGEGRICRVTVYEYRYSYVPMAAYSSAAISEIEVL